jgi:hypothetical protein
MSQESKPKEKQEIYPGSPMTRTSTVEGPLAAHKNTKEIPYQVLEIVQNIYTSALPSQDELSQTPRERLVNVIFLPGTLYGTICGSLLFLTGFILFLLQLAEFCFTLFRAKVMDFTAGFVFDGLVFRDIGAADGVFFHLFQGEVRIRFRPFSFDSKHRFPFPQYFVQDVANDKQQENTYDERHVSVLALYRYPLQSVTRSI